PLEWAWEEQELVAEEASAGEPEEETSDGGEPRSRERMVDWDGIAELWLPVMQGLLADGAFKLSSLRTMGERERQAWLSRQEAIDLWLMFYGAALTVPELGGEASAFTDERLVLLQRL